MNRLPRFNPRRFYLLIRNAMLLNISSILITSAAIGGILILFSAFDTIRLCNPLFYKRWYLLCLYIIGIIITGKIFKDVHDEAKGAAFLTLPASTFEKFASRVVVSTVIFAFGMMILFFLVSLIAEGLNRLFIGSCHMLFNPFDKQIIIGTSIYFIIQSPFLLGAVYFKKHALSKTFLSLIIYQFLFFLIAYVIRKVFSGDILEFSSPAVYLLKRISDILNEMDFVEIGATMSIIIWVARIIFWYVVAPLCWVIGYFRLKEAAA